MPTHGATQHVREDACSFTSVLYDANSITFALGFTHDLGPRCRGCRSTEATCARVGSCCDRCSHFGAQVVQLPARCGTERGYRAHRARKEPTCADCRAAHGHYNARWTS